MCDIRKYIIIEPHMEKTKNNLRDGQNRPISGSGVLKDAEIHFLERSFNSQAEILLVDLLSFSDLGSGRIETLKKLLPKNKNIHFILKKGSLEKKFQEYELPYLLFDENFKLNKNSNKTDFDFEIKDYKNFKLKIIESRILRWIKDATITPPENNKWITLQDGTKANKWIDIKGLVRDPEKSFYIAYQIGYFLSKGYTDVELKETDGFIVANNNAVSVASLLSIFFAKPLFIIDKLGPSPRVNPKWLIEIGHALEGKKLIIIEDVISTGREVDLFYFFLIYHRVEVKKIFSIVDLNCAFPILPEQSLVVSLCKPSINLKYKRILAYQKENCYERQVSR